MSTFSKERVCLVPLKALRFVFHVIKCARDDVQGRKTEFGWKLHGFTGKSTRPT